MDKANTHQYHDANAAHVRAISPIATNPATRFIFVTGGVVSGLGKGITISSIGRLLKSMNINVTCIKIDPYLNTDAGTMSPFEHGETFVLDDGGETDLDLGNYERFLDVQLTKEHNITTGKVYSSVIEKERRGDYLGKTVQVVPHITDEIQHRLSSVSQVSVDGMGGVPAVCLVEVGGTVGDIESSVFLEAIRQFILRVGRERCCLVHVSLVVTLGEQKTKPTQHGVKALMGLGLLPDIIVCRCAKPLEEAVRRKISVFCHVSPAHVVSVHDCSNIYHVPLILYEQQVHKTVLQRLNMLEYLTVEPNLVSWRNLTSVVDEASETMCIALVGKYTKLTDSYLSVNKALKHACIKVGLKLELLFVESSHLQASKENPEAYTESWSLLEQAHGLVIPGGFGERGIEGIIAAANYARTTKKPVLGICLGFQSMVIEYARNVLDRASANSAEFSPTAEEQVVVKMLEHHTGKMGGTMRLGARRTIFHPLKPGDDQEQSLANLLYGGVSSIYERHRHRYEVNPEYVESLEAKGLRFTGKDEEGKRMQVMELPLSDHPFFFAVQYHPELKSRPWPGKHSPPFLGLILAASGKLKSYFKLGESSESCANGSSHINKADNAVEKRNKSRGLSGSEFNEGLRLQQDSS